ncbi:unnamed protein product [Toxocara canis]|uniref:Transmembrane protein 128 n=1 Tax=Toxocara canis TaxID=6265 RepID=A0A183UEU2_TOXCA|nr:unnamed protein product [Toxocara canis]
MLDLEPPSPQMTVTPPQQECTGPVESNQRDDWTRRSTRVHRRPRRLSIEPKRRTYEDVFCLWTFVGSVYYLAESEMHSYFRLVTAITALTLTFAAFIIADMFFTNFYATYPSV